MNRKTITNLFALSVIAITAASVPLLVHAQTASPLLSAGFQIFPKACTCPGSAAAWGCILQTFQNILRFLVFVAVLALTIFIALAGFEYMTSGGSAEKRSAANKKITNAILGLFITLAAFLLVDSLMKVLYDPVNSQFGPWNSILATTNTGDDCLAIHNPPSSLPNLLGANPSGGSGSGTAPSTGAKPSQSSNAGANTAGQCAANHVLPASKGKCALYVRQDLACAGLTSFNSNHPEYAYQYGSYLTNAGFSTVSSSGYSPQSGDVIVFQPVAGHTSGHIEIFNGNNWDSDFSQNSMYANSAYQNGSYTIYRWPSGS